MPDIATVSIATSSGHDDCSPVKATTGQSVMTVNGNPVQVIGDMYEEHGCPIHPPHIPIITTGSSVMSINGTPVARVGDIIGDGGCTSEHTIVVGDSTVNVE